MPAINVLSKNTTVKEISVNSWKIEGINNLRRRRFFAS
jgi:hypothetical protein